MCFIIIIIIFTLQAVDLSLTRKRLPAGSVHLELIQKFQKN